MNTLTAAQAAEIIRLGGIVAYPTETFFGLGCDVFNAKALTRLAGIKQRPANKPFPVILGRAEQAAAFRPESAVPQIVEKHFWPGPLTIVLSVRFPLSAEICGVDSRGRHCVAMRVSGHAAARSLSLEAQTPITATSANISSRPPVCRVEDLDPALLQAVDGVMNEGPVPEGGAPSTVISIECAADVHVLRMGAVSKEALESAGFRVLAAASDR